MFLKNISKAMVFAITSVTCINVYGFEDDALSPYEANIALNDYVEQRRIEDEEWIKAFAQKQQELKKFQQKVQAERAERLAQQQKTAQTNSSTVVEKKKENSEEAQQEVASKSWTEWISEHPKKTAGAAVLVIGGLAYVGYRAKFGSQS